MPPCSGKTAGESLLVTFGSVRLSALGRALDTRARRKASSSQSGTRMATSHYVRYLPLLVRSDVPDRVPRALTGDLPEL
jgi:hypothetical protein